MDAGRVGITPEETAIFKDALDRSTAQMAHEACAAHLDIARVPGRDLSASIYAPFVLSSFVMSLRKPAPHLWNWIKRPGAVILIARPVNVDLFVGWLAAIPTENRIIATFVKAAYRASPEQRHRGKEENADAFRIASSLALTAGIDFGMPVKCSFWSRAARAISEKPGNPYSLRFEPESR